MILKWINKIKEFKKLNETDTGDVAGYDKFLSHPKNKININVNKEVGINLLKFGLLPKNYTEEILNKYTKEEINKIVFHYEGIMFKGSNIFK